MSDESDSTSMVISDDDDFQPAKKYSFYSQLSRSSSHSIDTRISESSDDEDFKPSSPKKKVFSCRTDPIKQYERGNIEFNLATIV